jgi:hypothetical protein
MGKPLDQPAPRVNIYDGPTGSKVLAWWYPDCGLPEGVYAVGTAHPAKCAGAGAASTTTTP